MTLVLTEQKHIDYMEGLTREVQEAIDASAPKRAYLASVRRLGVQSASVEQLQVEVETIEKSIRRSSGALGRIRGLLTAGAEPTTPPEAWYCGHLEKPAGADGTWQRDTWPRNTTGEAPETSPWSGLVWSFTPSSGVVARVFSGPIPVEALERYAAVKALVDDVRVYSPNAEDFQELRNPVLSDPVMIGSVTVMDQPAYFELARWDIDADLATIFGGRAEAAPPSAALPSLFLNGTTTDHNPGWFVAGTSITEAGND